MRERLRHVLRTALRVYLVLLVTAVLAEIALRAFDPRNLREDRSERSLTYDYDPELGWAPVPLSSSSITNERTVEVRHNSLGLRDIEFARDGRPSILFLGDSIVWGVDAEASERFTDLLRNRIASHSIVNAGVSAYGTDQEYLWLKRLWPKIEPAVVVLIFCTLNDRLDNTTNVRYGTTRKPWFAAEAEGALVPRGQPVPRSLQLYIRENWLVRHVRLVRFFVGGYVEIRYRQVQVPDPTERLVAQIRDFVAARGAKLLVALQLGDAEFGRYLEAEKIPYVSLGGAEAYPATTGAHWTREGHKVVAERIMGLLRENGIVGAGDAKAR